MTGSATARLIDLADYRRRRQPAVAPAPMPAARVAQPMFWWPVWVFRPVWLMPARA